MFKNYLNMMLMMRQNNYRYINEFLSIITEISNEMNNIDNEIKILVDLLNEIIIDPQNSSVALHKAYQNKLRAIVVAYRIDSLCNDIKYYDEIGRLILSHDPIALQNFINQITILLNKCINLKNTIKDLVAKAEKQYKEAWEKFEKPSIPTEYINVQGIWETTYGKMVLIQKDNRVTGYYSHRDGVIKGIMKNNVLVGIWGQKLTYAPPKQRGKVQLIFSNDSFTGKWGYANQEPSKEWNGKRISKKIDNRCNRFKIVNSSPDIPAIEVNSHKLKLNEASPYFYINRCMRSSIVMMKIKGKLLDKNIPLTPGFSYTLFVKGKWPNVEIDQRIDNPFPKKQVKRSIDLSSITKKICLITLRKTGHQFYFYVTGVTKSFIEGWVLSCPQTGCLLIDPYKTSFFLPDIIINKCYDNLVNTKNRYIQKNYKCAIYDEEIKSFT